MPPGQHSDSARSRPGLRTPAPLRTSITNARVTKESLRQRPPISETAQQFTPPTGTGLLDRRGQRPRRCAGGLSQRHGVIPPTLNFNPKMDLDALHDKARKGSHKRALNNSFGFDADDVALTFGKCDLNTRTSVGIVPSRRFCRIQLVHSAGSRDVGMRRPIELGCSLSIRAPTRGTHIDLHPRILRHPPNLANHIHRSLAVIISTQSRTVPIGHPPSTNISQ